MSNINWTGLRKAADIAAEQAKGLAIAQEKEALRQSLRTPAPRTNVRDLAARVEALEKYLGIMPLDAEGGT
jgi:hypothetical protein